MDDLHCLRLFCCPVLRMWYIIDSLHDASQRPIDVHFRFCEDRTISSRYPKWMVRSIQAYVQHAARLGLCRPRDQLRHLDLLSLQLLQRVDERRDASTDHTLHCLRALLQYAFFVWAVTRRVVLRNQDKVTTYKMVPGAGATSLVGHHFDIGDFAASL